VTQEKCTVCTANAKDGICRTCSQPCQDCECTELYRDKTRKPHAKKKPGKPAAGSGAGIGYWPAPSNPMAVAREIIEDYKTASGALTLRRWRGTWMGWHGTHWTEAEDTALRKDIYTRLELAQYKGSDGKPGPRTRRRSRTCSTR
jgi:hypothetical protein